MASQQHGFTWENEIKTKVFGVEEQISYTERDDIPAYLNDGVPVSIKTYGCDTIYLGDAIRMFQNSGRPRYELITLGYEQVDENTKTLTNVTEFDASNSRQLFFNMVSEQEILHLQNMIKSIPPGRPSAETKLAVEQLKKVLNDKSGAVKFNPKIDSANQRRLQCSITKYSRFLKANRDRIIDYSESGMLRGIQLTIAIVSGLRERNRRV
jgi:hypothetical protein